MNFVSLVVGIALGAAFSPFWMKVYSFTKSKVKSILNKETK